MKGSVSVTLQGPRTVCEPPLSARLENSNSSQGQIDVTGQKRDNLAGLAPTNTSSLFGNNQDV